MARERGNIALILCLLLLASGTGLYFFYRGASTIPVEKTIDPMVVFEEYRARAEATLNNPAVLAANVEKNPNAFACLFSALADCSAGGGPFLLYESAEKSSQPLGQLMVDVGFNAKGVGCRGFPSDACPFRVESSWSPVCGGVRCESTQSARLKVRVMYQPSGAPHQLWENEREITPSLTLSQAVLCERGGGGWTGTECLSPAQQNERQIASGAPALSQPVASNEVVEASPPVVVPDVPCPPDLEIQGEFHRLEILGPGRAQARVTAMNGCPGEDVFVFQCQPKSNEDREGQWVQIEAQMAPRCDNQPNAQGNLRE